MQNDLISRSALIAEHCDGCHALKDGLCEYDVCGAAQLIMEAPAVDPESLRPKGWWTENRRVGFSDAIEDDVCWFTYTCSECGGEVMNDYHYCPNCGAKMMER